MYYGWMKSCTSWSEIDGTLKPWHAQGVSHVPAVAGVFPSTALQYAQWAPPVIKCYTGWWLGHPSEEYESKFG